MTEKITQTELEAKTQAAVSKSLLLAKQTVRMLPIGQREQAIVCELLDKIFEDGFHYGGIWMADKVKVLINSGD